MSKTNGNFIYVAYNKAFPNSVKIGSSDNVERRMKEISGQTPSEFIPILRYEVDGRYKDNKIHKIIRELSPGLRVKGENYYMSPSKAITLFKNIAEITGTEDNLFIYENKFKQKHYFSFTSRGIPIGSEVSFIGDKDVKAKVVSDRHVEYLGKQTTLSVLATKLMSSKKVLKGENYFSYNNRVLSSY